MRVLPMEPTLMIWALCVWRTKSNLLYWKCSRSMSRCSAQLDTKLHKKTGAMYETSRLFCAEELYKSQRLALRFRGFFFKQRKLLYDIVPSNDFLNVGCVYTLFIVSRCNLSKEFTQDIRRRFRIWNR